MPPNPNVIMTTYLVGAPDPQRGQWIPNYEDTKTLRESVARAGEKLVLITDCFPHEKPGKHLEIVRVPEANINPYFRRWLLYRQYLGAHEEIGRAWCVDATDVELLRSPFAEMADCLYTGDEPLILGRYWMFEQHNTPIMVSFLRQNRLKQLLNAGLLGGTRGRVLGFMHEMARFNPKNAGNTDMGAFNWVAYNKFADDISHGTHVNTKFRAFDYTNTEAWWRHK